MRVTHKMIFNSFIIPLRRNQNRLFEIEEHLIAGKRVVKPSDDPVAAARISKLRGQLARTEQYIKNIDEGKTLLSAMETAVDGIKEALVRTQELILDKLSGAESEQDWQIAADELDNIIESVLQHANATHEGRYLFAGFASQSAPFDGDGNYLGRSGDEFKIEIGEGEYLRINICGDELMITSGGINIIQMLNDFRNHVAAGDADWLRDHLSDLHDSLDHILSNLSEIGVRYSRLEDARAACDSISFNISVMISELEDLDEIEAAAAFNAQKDALEAAMAAAASVLDQSFLDFLR